MLAIIIFLQTCWWWYLFIVVSVFFIVVLMWCFRSQQAFSASGSCRWCRHTSWSPAILSAETGTAELPSRGNWPLNPHCCHLGSCHQWEPSHTRTEQYLHWPGSCSCLKGSSGPRPCHLLQGSWQSTQAKQDQGGACLGPGIHCSAHERWEQECPDDSVSGMFPFKQLPMPLGTWLEAVSTGMTEGNPSRAITILSPLCTYDSLCLECLPLPARFCWAKPCFLLILQVLIQLWGMFLGSTRRPKLYMCMCVNQPCKH